MPLTDRFQKTWDTYLTKRGMDAIRDWEVEYQAPASEPVAGQPLPELVTKKRPLGIDVSNIAELIALQLNVADQFELIAAWLYPQWRDLVLTFADGELQGRDAFDEVCDAEFLDQAMTCLEVQAKRFFRGRTGQVLQEEMKRLESEVAERLRPLIRQTLRDGLRSAGMSTPESSDLDPPPAISPGTNSSSSTSDTAGMPTATTGSSV